MTVIFANVGPSGGLLTIGGNDNQYQNINVTHESTGTYRITWEQLDVVPVVVATGQHGVDEPVFATVGYLSNESMYIYIRDKNFNFIDDNFSFVMYY